MIKYGTKVRIGSEFKEGFYEGCEGIVLATSKTARETYVVELKTPMGISTEIAKILYVPGKYFTEFSAKEELKETLDNCLINEDI